MLFKNFDQLIQNGLTLALQQKRKDILDMLTAATEAVDPYLLVERVFKGNQLVFSSETIDFSAFDHLYLVGFGKASVGMAQAVCDSVSVTRGVVITNDPSAIITNGPVEVIVGGHPLPNEDSIRGTEKILDLLHQSTENDCVIVLISGGGSALLCQPRVSLKDLQKTTDLLLHSGATINELNTVRKRLSLVHGGQLARHIKGICLSLIISDVVYNPISSIASGPTSPDPTTFTDAKKLLEQHVLWAKIPETVRTVIEDGIAGHVPETVKENDPVFYSFFHFIIAHNEIACQGALKKARELGYDVKLITTSLEGEARNMGRYLVDRVKQSLLSGKSVFISGGEPTVAVRGSGTGGRNQELVLSCIEEIAGTEMVIASFATDGIDGNSICAGALADGMSLTRAKKKNLNPSCFLKQNNSYEFFLGLDDMLSTGPTGTNVMDIQIIIR